MKVHELIALLSTSDPDMPLRAVGVATRTCTSGNEKHWMREVIVFLPPDVVTHVALTNTRGGDR